MRKLGWEDIYCLDPKLPELGFKDNKKRVEDICCRDVRLWKLSERHTMSRSLALETWRRTTIVYISPWLCKLGVGLILYCLDPWLWKLVVGPLLSRSLAMETCCGTSIV
jgi:hypothetical protein